MLNKNEKWLKHTLRIPCKLDKWINYGAGTSGTCPLNNLPFWETSALDRKIPVMAEPPQGILYSRGEAGQDLIFKEPVPNFRLNDIHGHLTQLPYDALHDGNLAQHLKNPTVVRHLRKQGLLKDTAALCDLPTINKYRQYKRFMNLEKVHSQLQKEEEEECDKRRLMVIVEELRQRKTKWEMLQKFYEASCSLRQANAQKENLKRQKLLNNEVLRAIRVDAIQTLNENKKAELRVKTRRKSRRHRQRLQEIDKEKHTKMLLLLRRLRERQQKLEQQQILISQDKQKNKQEKIKEKWEQKKINLAEREVATQRILAEVKEEFDSNVDSRKAKAAIVKQEQNLMTKRNRLTRIVEKNKENRKEREHKIKKALLDAFHKDISLKASPVFYVIDCILENVIEMSAKNKIMPLMKLIETKMIRFGAQLLAELRASRLRRGEDIIRRPKTSIIYQKRIDRRDNLDFENSPNLQMEKSEDKKEFSSGKEETLGKRGEGNKKYRKKVKEVAGVRFSDIPSPNSSPQNWLKEISLSKEQTVVTSSTTANLPQPINEKKSHKIKK